MIYLNVFLNLMNTLGFWTKVAHVCSGILCGALKILCVAKLIGVAYFIGSIWGAEMQAVYNILTPTLM